MPSHESESLEGSSCKRLRVSSLVDMSGDEDQLFEMCTTASECLEELRSRGVDVAMWKKMVETAFDRNRLEALNRLIASMQKYIQAHDARQAAPLAPSPDPSALPALSFHSASPAPNSRWISSFIQWVSSGVTERSDLKRQVLCRPILVALLVHAKSRLSSIINLNWKTGPNLKRFI